MLYRKYSRWKTHLHGSLLFLHFLRAEAPTTFPSSYLSKDFCIVHSLGRSRRHVPLEQRVGFFTAWYAQYNKDNISLQNKRQVCLRFVIKYLSSLNVRFLRCNGTHYLGSIFWPLSHHSHGIEEQEEIA